MTRHIKCHSFEEDGTPRGGGCRRGNSCRFAHPTDPEWSTAVQTRTRRSPPPSRPRSHPRPMTPPPALPPLPTPPPILSKKPQPQKIPDQLRLIWEDRIKALADSTSHRQQLTKVEADIVQTRLLIDSSHFSALPEESKTRIYDQLSQLDRRHDELKKHREESIALLINADSWPATPLTDLEDKELSRYQDMINSVAQLKQQADSINSLLQQIHSRNNPDDDSLDVDPQEGPSSRPLKRRRAEGDVDVPPEPECGPTMEELQALSDKLAALHGRYHEFANDMNVHDAELRLEVENAIETRLEEFDESLKNSPPLGEQVYKEVKENIDTTGNEVSVLVNEVTDLLLEANSQKVEMEGIRARIETSKLEYAEIEEKFRSYEESREKDRKAIAALEQAVQTYIEQPPPPSAPGLTHDQLVELMEEPLLDIVRSTIKPLIEQLRNQVQDMLRTQNGEMYKTMWGKLSLTLRMVETISMRLDQVGTAAAVVAPRAQ